MKKGSLFSALAVCVMLSITTRAQKPGTTHITMDQAGKITVKRDSTKVKTPDSVYQVTSGITFYKGEKGGIYYWKTSKKTGQMYKCYVKK